MTRPPHRSPPTPGAPQQPYPTRQRPRNRHQNQGGLDIPVAGINPTSKPQPSTGSDISRSRQNADSRPLPKRRTVRKSGPGRIPLVASTAAVAFLTAACSSSAATSSPTSTTPPPTSHRHHVGVTGKIHSVSSSALIIDVHGKPETVTLTSTTTYRQGHHSIAISALTPGEKVAVRFSTASTAKTVTVLPASLSGIVTATTAHGFTLRSAHGTTTQIATSKTTTYRQRSKTVTAGALKNGEQVRVQGQPEPTGTFAATKVIVVSGGA